MNWMQECGSVGKREFKDDTQFFWLEINAGSDASKKIGRLDRSKFERQNQEFCFYFEIAIRYSGEDTK